MNILVTGASGFIGQHLIRKFGGVHSIFGIVLPSENIDGCVGLIKLDLKEKTGIVAAFEDLDKRCKIDAIIHMASEIAGAANVDDTQILFNNIRMTESVAEIARLVKPRKVINFSSMAVYPNKDGIYDEESETRTSCNSDCLYGLSKLCSENILDYLLRRENIFISHLRISNVYCEGMRSDRVIPAMKQELKEKGAITVFGSGERISSFISVDRLMEILSFFIDKDLSGMFNISEENISFLKLAERIIGQSDRKDARIIKIPEGSRVKFSLDTSKIDRILSEAEKDI